MISLLLRPILLLAALLAVSAGIVSSSVVSLLVGLSLAVLAFWNVRGAPVPSRLPPSKDEFTFFLLSGLALVGSSVAALISRQNNLNPAAPALWLAAQPLLLVAALRYDRGNGLRWLSWRQLRRSSVAAEVLGVGAVTLLAFGLRATDLFHFPPVMHGDEGEMGVLALQILNGKQPIPPFVTMWLAHPTLFHYLQAASLAIFGENEVGLRMVSAIFGTACVPLVYGIGRIGWGRLAALTAAWLLATSHLHIHFSRLGLNNIESVFIMLLVMLLLAKARSTPGIAPYVAIGLLLGIGQYLYYGSRLIPVVIAPLMLFLLLRHQARLVQVSALVAGAFVAFAPLGLFYLGHPHTFIERLKIVSVLNTEAARVVLGPEAVYPRDLLSLLQVQLVRNLEFFVQSGDRSSFYLQNLPAFDPVTSVLLWLGFGVALARLRRYHEFALLVWFVFGIALAGLITNYAPNAPRLIMMVPVVFILGGVFVARAWQLLLAATQSRLRPLGVSAWCLTAALVLLLNYNTYFVRYARHAAGLAPTMLAHEMAKEPERYVSYALVRPVMFADYGTIRFVAHRAEVHNLEQIDDLPPPDTQTKGTLVVALPHRVEELRAISARYPGGLWSEHPDPLGRPIFYSYRIAPRS